MLSSSMWLILALLLPLVLIELIKKKRDHNDAPNLPPGPWRLPVIGSLHHVLLRRTLPHRAMADIARRLDDAPLVYLKLGEIPAVVASSPDAAREVMRAHDANFATRPWTPTIRALVAQGTGVGFAPYGALWRQLRRIAMEGLLGARRVRSLRRVREEEVGRLVAGVAESAAAAVSSSGEAAAAVNISERIAAAVADSAMRGIIGGRFERREEFLENLAETVAIAAGFSLGDLFPSSRLANLVAGTTRRAAANHRKQFELMEIAIRQHEERRAAMGADAVLEEEEDLVDVLLRMQKRGGLEVPLTMGMIKAMVLDLFGAGSETSATTLQWAMSELMRNPRVMRKAQAEIRGNLQGKQTVDEDDLAGMKYIKLIIKETLRMYPPLPLLLPRQCRESCKVMGYDIPQGTTVFVNVWAINRDPRYWDDPTTFKPERFEAGTIDFKGVDFEFTPFGAGRRMCAGVAFAQANMELVLTALLYHFDWHFPGEMLPSQLDMTEEKGATIRRKHDLYLHPVVRVPPQPAP